MKKMAHDARYASDSFVFLQKQLEKVDEKILEPLTSTLWPRDMPVVTGGGFLENVASVDVSYATTGKEENALIMEQANDIPVMQADFGKTAWKTFNWAHYLAVPYLQEQKLKQIGMNIKETLDKGIHLMFDKFTDKNVYLGFDKVNTTGLVNNANVTRVTADPHTASGTDTTWAEKTADEILADINDAIAAVWAANDMSPDALPDHILIPVEQFGAIVTRKVGTTGDKSILTYILENNLTNQQGGNLVISPCSYCDGVGTDSSDRMVVYINDVSKIRFHQTSPLHRLETEITQLTYKTPYVAQVSEVEFLYPTTVRYVDGI